MEQEIRGRFINGKVELLEEADLKEGEEVTVVIPSRHEGKEIHKGFLGMPNSWKDDPEYWEEVLRSIYKDGHRRILTENE